MELGAASERSFDCIRQAADLSSGGRMLDKARAFGEQ
jgi:hypothetical protein